jgi:hypothetical protein
LLRARIRKLLDAATQTRDRFLMRANRRAAQIAILLAGFVGFAACDEDRAEPDAGPDAQLDGGPGADTGTDGSAVTDGATDAPADVELEAAFDAGACPILLLADGGPCNPIAVTGSAVVPVCHDAAPPTPVGGPIYNGHYVLTNIDYYNAAGACPTQSERIDWSICGTVWATAQVAQSTTRVNAAVDANGSTLDITLTCPNPGTATWTYDATSTGIVLYMSLTGVDGGEAVRADTYVRM